MKGIIWKLLGAAVLAALAYYVYAHAQRPPASAGAAAAPQEEAPVSAQASVTGEVLAGTWRSTQDPKFTREFSADGTVTDRYEGDANATTVGSWTVFTSADAESGLPVTPQAGVTYLKIVTQYEAMFFSVLTVDAERLQLSYLDRGNTLDFTRVR